MAGIRIMSTNAHDAGKTILIDDPQRICGHNGMPKRYTLHLDDQAAVLVSEGVWEALQAVMALSSEMPRLVAVGEVAMPPTITVSDRVRMAPVEFWTPGGDRVVMGITPVPDR